MFVLALRLKPESVKLLNTNLVTLNDAYHATEELGTIHGPVILLLLLILILIIIHSRILLDEGAFGPMVGVVHTLFLPISSSLLLSVVVNVRNISSNNSINCLAIFRSFGAEIVVNDLKFIGVRGILHR
jgi:hypothetical protein